MSLVVGACAGGDGAAAPSVPTAVDECPARPASCTLRRAADAAGVLVGAAVEPDRLEDPAYAGVVAEELSSVTPENAMKWPQVHPAADEWVFAPADRLVAFAEEHDLGVRGHTLLWGQAVGNGIPDWVSAIDDPVELQQVVDDHIATLVGRYAGRVDRWDVVNEPLVTTGSDLDANHFLDVLGPGYIAAAFASAHQADPDARLFVNENAVELFPEKAQALVDLVQGLVADGVPIDGVGLQAHQFSGHPPEPGVFEELVAELVDLGVEVAITELDLPVPEGGDLEAQPDGYRQIVRECLAAGCSEITTWGVDDGDTWLDDFLGREGTSPLLFDDDLEPKPAYAAVVEELAAAASPPSPPPGDR